MVGASALTASLNHAVGRLKPAGEPAETPVAARIEAASASADQAQAGLRRDVLALFEAVGMAEAAVRSVPVAPDVLHQRVLDLLPGRTGMAAPPEYMICGAAPHSGLGHHARRSMSVSPGGPGASVRGGDCSTLVSAFQLPWTGFSMRCRVRMACTIAASAGSPSFGARLLPTRRSPRPSSLTYWTP